MNTSKYYVGKETMLGGKVDKKSLHHWTTYQNNKDASDSILRRRYDSTGGEWDLSLARLAIHPTVKIIPAKRLWRSFFSYNWTSIAMSVEK